MKTTKVLLAMLFCIATTACGGGSTTVNAPKYLDSLSVSADPLITVPGPGGSTTQQYHAMVKYSDGTTQDASGIVTWTSSDDLVVTVDKNGLGTINVTNIKNNNIQGDVTIWATFVTAFGSITFTVSPTPSTSKSGSPIPVTYDLKTAKAA